MIYQIEEHTIKEYIVTVRRGDKSAQIPIAKCNSMGAALTIKGLYEKAEKEDEQRE